MKLLIVGGLVLLVAVTALSSPYWLFREIARPSDEPLPRWMGDARTRKVRLVVIVGVMALVFGGLMLAVGLTEE
ncbi:unnamed protein product [Gemmataceae bacterium]|nr:unnamed protein product [Gemmataceae bacterium]VTT97949.1 unnamed protein product [Gemmataceae bacterium]